MASVGMDIGFCGFGIEGGLLPNVRIGVVRVWWCRGAIGARVIELSAALTAAKHALMQAAGSRVGRAAD